MRKPDRGELRLIEMLGREPELVTQLILANNPVGAPAKKAVAGKASSRKKTASAA